MNIPDDLYLGYYLPSGLALSPTTDGAPQLQQGVGPMGRVYVFNAVPLAKQTANVAALQHMTIATPLVLTAGTGVTKGVAPDGSGATVMKLDVDRCLSLTGSASLVGVNFTIVGFDRYGAKLTQTRAGPATIVNTLKSFASVLSVTPDATDGVNNVSIGTADIFGLPFYIADAGYILPSWAETLGLDAGTFVAGVATVPSTALLGDVRGTYAPSSASDGTKRLVAWLHLTGIQCGPNATRIGLLGQPQV